MRSRLYTRRMLTRVIVLLCFFFSGATGLLYEVVWIRLFGFTLGNTHHSITIVVSVFMGGLALGSWLGGRVADRSRDPLRLYGALILAIGVVCIAIPFLIDAFEPLFRWIYSFHEGDPQAWPLMLAKLGVASAILLVPTTLMGATLPVLSRWFTRSVASVGWDFGRLYAVNTFGAVCGASLTGFVLIPAVGLWWCIVIAVIVDLVIAAAVFAMARAPGARPAATGGDTPPRDGDEPALPGAGRVESLLPVIAFALSGFANMMLQIGWTKALVGTIGNSTYAFSLIVTLFILGIGIGGAIMARLADRIRNTALALGILLVVTAGVVLVTIPELGILPARGALLFHDAARGGDTFTFGDLVRGQFLIVSLFILPATTLMGMVFPLVGKWVTRQIETVGRSIGNAYFMNTAGSILGTLTAGFVLIPLLDRVYWTLYAAVAISLVMGLVLCLRFAPSLRSRLASAAGAVVVIGYAGLTLPHGVLGSRDHAWHPALHSLGVYLYYDIAEGTADADAVAQKFIKASDILYFTEGVHASVAVAAQPGTGKFALRISGKPEGSANADGSATNDMPHQLGAAHVPMLLHPGPREVLTLGLGSGVTLGALTLYSVSDEPESAPASPIHTVEHIDSLEISPEVLEAVELHFARSNHDATRHPRVRHVLGDGRNHLLLTDRTYDVITSVPSNPWIAGIGNLFTEEFFRIVRDRLAPDGVFCQWIHTLRIRVEDFNVVLRTIREVFPEHLQLWDLGYDCVLIASSSPIRVDFERVRQALADPLIAADLDLLGIAEPAQLARHLKLDSTDIGMMVGRGPTNRDLAPYLEFEAPKGLYGHYWETFQYLASHRPSTLEDVWRGATPEVIRRAESLRATFLEFQRVYSIVKAGRGDRSSEVEHYRAIVGASDPWLEQQTAALSTRSALAVARLLIGANEPARARAVTETGLERGPRQLDLLRILARTATQLGDREAAAGAFERALEAAPDDRVRAQIHNDRGYAAEVHGDLDRAVVEYRTALELDSTLLVARNNLKRALDRRGLGN